MSGPLGAIPYLVSAAAPPRWHIAFYLGGGGETGDGGDEAGARARGNAGGGAEVVVQGYFTCSLVAETLVLTAAGWELSELRGSG